MSSFELHFVLNFYTVATAKKTGSSVSVSKKTTNATNKSNQKETKVKKGPTPEDLAATKIQRYIRGCV